MPLIPLTSQRLEQLSAAVNSLAAALQTQLMPLQPQISGLALFASANKSTAEELLQAGTAGGLVSHALIEHKHACLTAQCALMVFGVHDTYLVTLLLLYTQTLPKVQACYMNEVQLLANTVRQVSSSLE